MLKRQKLRSISCIATAPSRTGLFSTARNDHRALRILLCGADEFSVASLRAVHQLQTERPEKIASLDVVCRPDKRVGRGLKQLHEVPIKSVAQELKLPIHQIDTFTNWSPPTSVDLIIAVSFGLLVPSRILNAATFGGVNVHPSMLPDLRGPAPIQHALLSGRSYTGVTLQTMHPTRFDHGLILAQTPAPGIPIPQDLTLVHAIDTLALAGAEMLVDAIKDDLFVSPSPVVGLDAIDPEKIMHAPKITPKDRHIDWSSWTADRIQRYDRVLGRLWDTTTYQHCFGSFAQAAKRVTFHGPWSRGVSAKNVHYSGSEAGAPGVPGLWIERGSGSPRLAFRTIDGDFMAPEAATLEGEQKGKAIAQLCQALRCRLKGS